MDMLLKPFVAIFKRVVIGLLIGMSRSFSLDVVTLNDLWSDYVEGGKFWESLRDNSDVLFVLLSSAKISIEDMTEVEISRLDGAKLELALLSALAVRMHPNKIRRIWNFLSVGKKTYLLSLTSSVIFDGLMKFSGTYFTDDHLLDHINDTGTSFEKGKRILSRNRAMLLYKK